MLHLCWHEQLVNQLWDDVDKPYSVQPQLLLEETNDITAMCRLIADRLKTGWQIPYAFHFVRKAYFSATTGELFLPDGAGLTCSTFFVTVFASVGVHLVDVTDLEIRQDDIERHKSLLEMMKNGIKESGIPPAPPEHVARVSVVPI